MMRSHGTNTPREIWQFGEKGTWSYDAIEKYIKLRYRLIPYLYSTAWQVTSNGASIMEPLYFDFEQDEKAHTIVDEYMFGESILVSPVTESMYIKSEKRDGKYINAVEDFSDIKTSEVYLPQGSKWIDFWTGKTLEGGQMIERKTPIDLMPLYLKAGSIIPWGPEVQYAEEKKWDQLEIRIYPGADGKFVLYEDENDNYNYVTGQYSTIEFQWNDKTQTLTIGEQEGDFTGIIKSRTFNLAVINKNNGLGLNKTAISSAVK